MALALRPRRLDLTVTVVCLGVLGYFAWYGDRGPRGFPYRDGLAAQVAALQSQAREIADQRDQLEHRVSLLRPDTIDPDMLDELARNRLEMAAPNELVIFPKGGNPN
jgi:cell division protein FtsB